jgi:hypothetical protein
MKEPKNWERNPSWIPLLLFVILALISLDLRDIIFDATRFLCKTCEYQVLRSSKYTPAQICNRVLRVEMDHSHH